MATRKFVFDATSPLFQPRFLLTLTPDNCVLTLIDHQPQMLFGVSNFDRQTIINFDTVGGAMFEPSLRSLRVGGRHIAIASAGGRRVSFDLVDFYC